MRSKTSPRTYNQVEVPRPYTPGRRRFSIYWTWSYPWEANRDVTQMDNRFSTMTEVRRVAWPAYETPEYAPQLFLQGIAGTLELFHLSLLRFQQLVGELTDHPVAVYQRVDQAGQKLPIDAGILDDTDTLMVFGLDHLVTEQEAAPEEIDAMREWLKREGTCLLLGPHHDVGVSTDLKERALEYAHHRDPLVPRQQRFGQYTRSVMKGLGVPVHNQYGLRPATVQGTRQLQPLVKHADLDARGWLEGVQTFNFHPHLPHYAITKDDASAIRLLAQQPIDVSRPHPFTEAGHREFNMFLWMPPKGDRAGDILLADSTIFTTLFGGDESLERFWKKHRDEVKRRLSGAGLMAVCMLVVPQGVHAQSRGVYPLGMTAVGSGVTPDPGFTYANQLLFYSRDQSKAVDGSTQPVSGQNAVIMDMNSLVWVSRRTFLGGAHYSAVATLPIAKNQLVSDIHGQLSGGGGFADSYYLPLILGWNKERASIRALVGVLAPTGRFSQGASDNVGSGYWTPTLSSGQTVQLTRNKVTLSAFELYEWHTTQQGTDTQPGDTINLDYSLIRTFAFAKGPTRLQVGLTGYEQRQTTAKTGRVVSEDQSRERYAINALGFVTNVVLPNHRFNAGIKFFEEFRNRAAYQGYSLQVSGAFSF